MKFFRLFVLYFFIINYVFVPHVFAINLQEVVKNNNSGEEVLTTSEIFKNKNTNDDGYVRHFDIIKIKISEKEKYEIIKKLSKKSNSDDIESNIDDKKKSNSDDIESNIDDKKKSNSDDKKLSSDDRILILKYEEGDTPEILKNKLKLCGEFCDKEDRLIMVQKHRELGNKKRNGNNIDELFFIKNKFDNDKSFDSNEKLVISKIFENIENQKTFNISNDASSKIIVKRIDSNFYFVLCDKDSYGVYLINLDDLGDLSNLKIRNYVTEKNVNDIYRILFYYFKNDYLAKNKTIDTLFFYSNYYLYEDLSSIKYDFDQILNVILYDSDSINYKNSKNVFRKLHENIEKKIDDNDNHLFFIKDKSIWANSNSERYNSKTLFKDSKKDYYFYNKGFNYGFNYDEPSNIENLINSTVFSFNKMTSYSDYKRIRSENISISSYLKYGLFENFYVKVLVSFAINMHKENCRFFNNIFHVGTNYHSIELNKGIVFLYNIDLKKFDNDKNTLILSPEIDIDNVCLNISDHKNTIKARYDSKRFNYLSIGPKLNLTTKNKYNFYFFENNVFFKPNIYLKYGFSLIKNRTHSDVSFYSLYSTHDINSDKVNKLISSEYYNEDFFEYGANFNFNINKNDIVRLNIYDKFENSRSNFNIELSYKHNFIAKY